MQNTDDADEPEETVFVNGDEGEEQQGTDNEGASSAQNSLANVETPSFAYGDSLFWIF